MNEALAAVSQTEEQVYEAELYRLKGELTLLAPTDEGNNGPAEVEDCFLQALAIARRQGARWNFAQCCLWAGFGSSRETMATITMMAPTQKARARH